MTLSITDVTKRYKIRVTGSQVNALNGVSLDLPAKQTLGIVGESGCGKSTLARMIVGLEQPTSGSVTWNGAPIFDKAKNMFSSKHSKIQLVFQDPYSSLNPRQKIGDSIAEVLTVHRLVEKNAVAARIDELLTEVGISPELAHRYPHQLSGGQRQRIGIARALYHRPSVLVLDEATSSLDTETEHGVMQAVQALQGDKTVIIVAHRLSTVEYCDRLYRLDAGRIVDEGTFDEVMNRSQS